MATTALDALSEQAAIHRIPLYATAELTWRCNFACVHCYQEGLRQTHRELSTAEWKSLLSELAELGCLFLTLTGGEALVRKDYPEIYLHALELGFLVTVFTNGALIDDQVLSLWTAHPPRKVEITLYGMSAETYARVTGRPKGFAATMEAIDRLTALGLRVELKVPAMRPLLADLPAMRAFAQARGLSFREDPSLFPRLDGNKAPLAHRLSPAETLQWQESRGDLAAEIQACFADVPSASDHVYRCSAGANALNIDPSGHIDTCIISRGSSLDWRSMGVRAAWAGLGPEAARTYQLPAEESCGGCGSRDGCTRCPGLSWMERGHVEKRIDHHCELTSLKLKVLGRAA